jgi:hypothetical protein
MVSDTVQRGAKRRCCNSTADGPHVDGCFRQRQAGKSPGRSMREYAYVFDEDGQLMRDPDGRPKMRRRSNKEIRRINILIGGRTIDDRSGAIVNADGTIRGEFVA